MKLIKGKFSTESQPGIGTTIHAWVHLANQRFENLPQLKGIANQASSFKTPDSGFCQPTFLCLSRLSCDGRSELLATGWAFDFVPSDAFGPCKCDQNTAFRTVSRYDLPHWVVEIAEALKAKEQVDAGFK
jgi:hypothetical protein